MRLIGHSTRIGEAWSFVALGRFCWRLDVRSADVGHQRGLPMATTEDIDLAIDSRSSGYRRRNGSDQEAETQPRGAC